jgi:diacylglycerol O-acyltransferase
MAITEASPQVTQRPGTAYVYEPLSSEDRMFLLCERRDVHMHVAATLIFETGPSRGGRDGGIDVERIVRYVESRLELVPRYRQRLRTTPLTGNPVWIDDDRFDLAFHVRPVPAPPPGDDVALKKLASHVISTPLDRSRPLWKMWIVTGLQGNRFAVIVKMHHCMVDGIAGADLLAVLLASAPTHEVEGPRPFVPRPAPARWELLRDTVWQRLQLPITLGRATRRLLTGDAAAQWLAYGRGLCETAAAAAWPAPESPLNRPIGRHRRFDWTVLDFGEVQGVRARLGGTVNDVALAVVAGALRRFLLERHPDSELRDLRVMIPVNVRNGGERHLLGNHVSAWLMTLPVREAGVARRYAAVCAATQALKASRQHLGGQLVTSAGSTLLALGSRVVERLRPYNLLVTNVPGPRDTLYLLGARLRCVYPEAPLFPGQGVGIALFSYADALCLGIHADCHVVPDTERLVEAVHAAFDELLALAGMDRAAAGTPPWVREAVA